MGEGESQTIILEIYCSLLLGGACLAAYSPFKSVRSNASHRLDSRQAVIYTLPLPPGFTAPGKEGTMQEDGGIERMIER